MPVWHMWTNTTGINL